MPKTPKTAAPLRKPFTFLLHQDTRAKLEETAHAARRSLASEIELRLELSLARQDLAEMFTAILEIICDPTPSLEQRARAADLLRWIMATSQGTTNAATFAAVQERLGRPGLANLKKYLGRKP